MNLGKRGFIDDRYNLICDHGHRHWAPSPDAWKSKHCGCPVEGTKGCREPLSLIEDSPVNSGG